MSYHAKTNLVNQLRDAIVHERDEMVRFNLAESADNLQAAINNFGAIPTGDFLVTLQSEWARAVRVLGSAGLPQAWKPT